MWAGTGTARHGRWQESAAVPLATPVSVVMAAAAIGVAAGLLLAGWMAIGGPWSPAAMGGPAAASPSPTPTSALLLDDPGEGGRDIVVAADGQGHFRTLTEAVAAAVDGDRITIEPGEYHDSVTIDKTVTLRGEGGPDAVIVAPADPGTLVGGPSAGYYPESGGLVEGWRYVIYLDHSDAQISGLTIRGAEVGTAVVVEGGAPTLDDVVIDPDGEQRNKTASSPHEGLAIGQASTATVRDSLITAFIGISEGSRVTMTGNTVRGSCLVISGVGTDPIIRENHFENSQCPRITVTVSDGAAPTLEANVILSDQGTDGIRVTGPGSTPKISGNVVSGGEFGIWVGDGAEATIRRNLVTVARTGVEISGAATVLDSNEIRANGTGIVLDKGATVDFVGNSVCENEVDVELRDGARVPAVGNVICDGGAATAVTPSEP